MQIDSSALPATSSSTSSSGTTAADTNAAIASTTGLGNEDTFLQLLVAQIQNQDPTNPIDSTTFLTQLASFSSLEQLIGINQGVQSLDTAVAPATGTSTGTTSTSNTQNS